jgi:hypothetical protein
MQMSAKFPRIPHLPFSPGATPDDERMADVSSLVGAPLILTEKVDGANVCLTREMVYARSHSGPAKGAMFDQLKALHADKRFLIAPNLSIFCEWCMFVHSLEYQDLPDPPLLVLGVRHDTTGVWRSFREVENLALELKFETVPALGYLNPSTAALLREQVEEVARLPSKFGGVQEGIVVRHADAVADNRFSKFHAKYVREGFKAGESFKSAGLAPQPGVK